MVAISPSFVTVRRPSRVECQLDLDRLPIPALGDTLPTGSGRPIVSQRRISRLRTKFHVPVGLDETGDAERG